MRIIAGICRGRNLKAPKGMNTRPTTDRVRESLMSIISSARGGFEDAFCLDAFAGSGALGFEALSRGAAAACFCDKSPQAIEVLKENARSLGFNVGQAIIRRTDCLKSATPTLHRPYDLAFLDPPYRFDPADIIGLVSALDHRGGLDQNCLISYEHGAESCPLVDRALEKTVFALVSRRTWGDTVIDFIRRDPEVLTKD